MNKRKVLQNYKLKLRTPIENDYFLDCWFTDAIKYIHINYK